MRDGSGIIQCVAVKSALPEELFESLKHLTQESSLIVRGKIRAEARAPGGFELDVESADIVQRVPESDPYPITPKEHGIDFLMDHRHLWLRSRRQHAALLVRHEVIKAIRDYFDSHGFILVDTPIFTPAACEGTTTLFEVDYFEDEKVYLTQSGQLYSEATAAAFGKTYCFGPVFRAEKSKTRRHLTEFWMVEPEMAFADLEDVKRVGEELIVHVIGRVLENRREDLKVLERDVSKLEAVKAPFHRMTYDEAVEKLKAKGSEIQWGSDFGNTDETLITEDLDRPVMIDRYPAAVKAFYFAAGRRIVPMSRWASISSRPKVTARSSAAASASTIWICCSSVWKNTSCRARPSSGIWICASTAASRTPASAWASSVSSPGCAAWSMSAKPSRSRG